MLLIGLFGVNKAFGQFQKDLKKALDTQNSILLKKYTDKILVHYKNTTASWSCSREITSNYREEVINIKKIVPDKNDAAIATIYSFRVNLILHGNTIIYYDFSEKKNRKAVHEWSSYGETEWVEYFEPIAKFKSTNGYLDFRKDFSALFQADIQETEIFTVGPVYGEHCYISGTDPTGRVQVNNFVRNKDKKSLLKWLQSGNTEKQVYAVDGLWQLGRMGIKLTAQELKMVSFVKNTKSCVSTCSGCLSINWSVHDMTSKFKF